MIHGTNWEEIYLKLIVLHVFLCYLFNLIKLENALHCNICKFVKNWKCSSDYGDKNKILSFFHFHCVDFILAAISRHQRKIIPNGALKKKKIPTRLLTNCHNMYYIIVIVSWFLWKWCIRGQECNYCPGCSFFKLFSGFYLGNKYIPLYRV